MANFSKLWQPKLPSPQLVEQTQSEYLLNAQSPGAILRTMKTVLVVTGDGLLQLVQVQPRGKKPMAAA